MEKRLRLQSLLEGVLESKNVYFQPPEEEKMNYPCIVYSKISEKPIYADNGIYTNRDRYLLTIIDRSPDSQIPKRVAKLPLCRFERQYKAKNLNHIVYNLYF